MARVRGPRVRRGWASNRIGNSNDDMLLFPSSRDNRSLRRRDRPCRKSSTIDPPGFGRKCVNPSRTPPALVGVISLRAATTDRRCRGQFQSRPVGCAGDVPQSIAVAKDGAGDITPPCTINLGHKPHAPRCQRPLRRTSRCGILKGQSVQGAVSRIPVTFCSTAVKHRRY